MFKVMQHPADRLMPKAIIFWCRGWWAAALCSLLLHGWMLHTINRGFDFKFNQHSGNAPLSTRMILTANTQDAAAATNSTSSNLAQTDAAQRMEPQRVETTPSQPVPESFKPAPVATARSTAAQPNSSSDPTFFEQNRSSAGIKTAQSATDSIANPTSSENVGTGTGQASAQPSAAPRLLYPQAADLEYQVVRVQRGQTSSGTGMLLWKSDGSAYELLLEWGEPTAPTLRQSSVGQFDVMGLAPERFGDKRATRSEQATHFRRLEGVIVFSNNKPSVSLQAGTQDPLSVLIQLAGILGGDPKRYEIVNIIRLPVAGLDGAQLWEIDLDKPADINVAAANMRAIKLQRKPRTEYDSRLEIWLSPQLGYLPIRIRQSEEHNPEANYTEFSLKRLP